MPRDMSRVTYDENGGMVTEIPKGTPKQELEKARAKGERDKNDPKYTVEDAQKDAETQDKLEKEKNPTKYENRRMGTPNA